MIRLAILALLLSNLLPAAPQWTGSRACAGCHAAIYKSYMRTPMAASSGPVGEGMIPERFDNAEFTHRQSGYRYRIIRNGSQYSFAFEKGAGAARVAGGRTLKYFVGSGAAARSYLLDFDGFLFEAPVTYYAQRNRWDLPPGYDRHEYPFLTRPIAPGCLQCHASRLQHRQATLNGYDKPPFLEGGIACERCHGPGGDHRAIINPAKLAPETRDSICAQCHLSGEARVIRAGRTFDSFIAGDRLADHAAVFVRSGVTAGMKVTSHVENLAQSACKKSAGDRLWCGTCHDPHTVPDPAARASWFRSKCFGCHETNACQANPAARRSRADDCTACHMPRNPVSDAEHVVYTDHSIPRRPGTRGTDVKRDAPLILFGGGEPDPRDLGLAYSIAGQQAQAFELLRRLEDMPDPEVIVALADQYKRRSDPMRAIELYERALRIDPAQLTALVNLGALRMERGEYAEAIRLWEDALTRNPGLVLVRGNLAVALQKTGNPAAAKAILTKAAEFNPLFRRR